MRKCLYCENEINPYDGACIINRKERCWNCFKPEEFNGEPYFVQYIPNMVTGADREYFNFKSTEELKEKLSKHLKDDFILVKDNDTIMKQGLEKDTWWVLGFIKNMKMKDIELPNFNPTIYNKNGKVNKEKMQEWLGK